MRAISGGIVAAGPGGAAPPRLPAVLDISWKGIYAGPRGQDGKTRCGRVLCRSRVKEACHFLDLVRSLTGADPVSVDAASIDGQTGKDIRVTT